MFLISTVCSRQIQAVNFTFLVYWDDWSSCNLFMLTISPLIITGYIVLFILYGRIKFICWMKMINGVVIWSWNPKISLFFELEHVNCVLFNPFCQNYELIESFFSFWKHNRCVWIVFPWNWSVRPFSFGTGFLVFWTWSSFYSHNRQVQRIYALFLENGFIEM